VATEEDKGQYRCKENVKFSLSLIKHHGMKTYRGVEVQPHTFLTSALHGHHGQLHAWLLETQGIPPSTQWVGHWASQRADLDVVEKRKISCSCLESNSNSSIIQSKA
jgi:hypothetical protein